MGYSLSSKKSVDTPLLRINEQSEAIFSSMSGSDILKNDNPLQCSPDTLSDLMRTLEFEMFGTLPGNSSAE